MGSMGGRAVGRGGMSNDEGRMAPGRIRGPVDPYAVEVARVSPGIQSLGLGVRESGGFSNHA
jgi:hypothetical protein